MGAGLPPFFFPIPDEVDNQFTVLTALAYGLRGFNIYMAVERDRWIGAPIDPQGRARPSRFLAASSCAALEEVQLSRAYAKLPVRIVIPASQRRLNRALHAFSPATPALFAVTGERRARELLRGRLRPGRGGRGRGDAFVECFERALSAARGAFRPRRGLSQRPNSLAGARWVICPTTGASTPRSGKTLERARRRGRAMTIGPRAPACGDGALALFARRSKRTRSSLFEGDADAPAFEPQARKASCRPRGQRAHSPSLGYFARRSFVATVHQDATGQPRVLFVINPTTAAGALRRRAFAAVMADRRPRRHALQEPAPSALSLLVAASLGAHAEDRSCLRRSIRESG